MAIWNPTSGWSFKAYPTDSEDEKTNQKNEAINAWTRNFINYASNVQPGTYLVSRESLPVDQLNSLLDQGILSKSEYNNLVKTAKDSFKEYYKQEKVGGAWDARTLGALDPSGQFNPKDYAEYNPDAVKKWTEAVAADDVDITSRYTKDTYLWQDYTAYGKFAGYRGSKPLAEETTKAYKYQETLTDAEKQKYRDQILGITTDATGKQRIVFSKPEYDAQGNLITNQNINTLLEKTFAETLQGEDLKKERQLTTLAQDLLKTSIDALKKAKEQEAKLSMLSGLSGYNEILNINSTLTNSILGDSGIGGILSLTGGSKEYQKKMEADIGSITGISSNSTVYNWQQWFDETLRKRYENYELETQEYGPDELKNMQAIAKEEIASYQKTPSLGKPIYLEIAEKYKENGRALDVNNLDDFKKIMFNIDVEAKREFMSNFVENYIKPRFDQSKSMDEFISYIDVEEKEQNVFQSQTTVNKLKQIADLRAKSFLYLTQQAERAVEKFNPDFYLDPLKNKTKEVSAQKLENYQIQKDTIAKDFENAKAGVVGDDGVNWALEAYRYGFENTYQTDPAVFAKLHYQAKGSTGMIKNDKGESIYLDPAEDILPYEELTQKIKDFGIEMAARKDFYGGSGFMKFVTPEDFANATIGSLDPQKNKEEWDKVLKSVGLEGTNANVDDVKKFLMDQIQTEQAGQIRENIKYLNENQEELNQKNLGVSYIERPTDVQKTEGKQTALYSLFKSSGYGGTEDEFYNDFFPDVDRSEQELISTASSGKGLDFAFGDMQDPFQAFSGVSGLFGGEEETTTSTLFNPIKTLQQEDDTPKSSYFKLFEDEEDDVFRKSAAADSFLSDFTSMFKSFR